MRPGGNGERTSCSLVIVCAASVQTLEQDKIGGIRAAKEGGEEQGGGGT